MRGGSEREVEAGQYLLGGLVARGLVPERDGLQLLLHHRVHRRRILREVRCHFGTVELRPHLRPQRRVRRRQRRRRRRRRRRLGAARAGHGGGSGRFFRYPTRSGRGAFGVADEAELLESFTHRGGRIRFVRRAAARAARRTCELPRLGPPPLLRPLSLLALLTRASSVTAFRCGGMVNAAGARRRRRHGEGGGPPRRRRRRRWRQSTFARQSAARETARRGGGLLGAAAGGAAGGGITVLRGPG